VDQDKRTDPQVKPSDMEERGVVSNVIVPILAGGAAGAVNAVVSNAINKPKDKD
jgi:hypothetical protein